MTTFKVYLVSPSGGRQKQDDTVTAATKTDAMNLAYKHWGPLLMPGYVFDVESEPLVTVSLPDDWPENMSLRFPTGTDKGLPVNAEEAFAA